MSSAALATAPRPTARGETFLGVTQSVSGRRWRARLKDDQSAAALGQALGVSDIIARVLAGRGVPVHEALRYLNPSLKTDLPDPSVLVDMDRAAERLARAVMNGESIALFGDYDVDGATSSAVLARFLGAVGACPRIYIPDRHREGYGPSVEAFATLASEGARLIVTLDCGTRSHEPIAFARRHGLDVIVIDHHLPPAELPRAFALVNPARTDDQAGLQYLCAAGLAFLLVVALNRRLREAGHYGSRAEPDLRPLLDLVALGTVCDVVPLIGLNRTFVAQGLKVMRGRKNTGLSALAEVARVGAAGGTYDLAFLIGPRINAGGRLADSSIGVRLLMTEDAQEAKALAAELDRLNRARRAIEAEVEAAAVAAAESLGDLPPVLTLAGAGWHTGVVGIVAGRLKDRFGRPALVLGIEGEEGALAKGSGRSLKGVDLGSAIGAAEQAGLILKGGGHAMAVGLTAAETQVKNLSAFLASELAGAVAAARGQEALDIDAVIAVGGASRGLLEDMQIAGPYGHGNPEPMLAVARARIAYVAPAGEQHLRVVLEGEAGGRLRAVAFRSVGTPLGDVLAGERDRLVHVAGTLKADDWAGRGSVQLVIEDAAYA